MVLPFTLNNYASLLFSIVQDRLIDSTDLVRIADKSTLSALDTLWYCDLFTDQYFSKRKDSLSDQQKSTIDSNFIVANETAHLLFCKDLNQLIEKINIEADTADFINDQLQIVLQQDTCDVFIK